MSKRAKPDHYAELARKEGYPARSVYKLKEIQEKFHVMGKGERVLDVGAAPGSWSMYAHRVVGPKGSVCGVDLQPVLVGSKLPGYVFICGDAFTPEIRQQLVQHGSYSTVLSDAAPKTTGNRIVDTGRSAELVHEVLALSLEVLKPGGSLVAKVFQGGDERELLELLKTHFSTARFFKPKASRNESFEIFVVAAGFGSR